MTTRSLWPATALVALLISRPWLLDGPLVVMATLATVVSVICVLAVVRSAPLGLWSSAPWYAVVLILFHFGLALPYAFGYHPLGAYGDYVSTWFTTASFRVEAVYLSSLAVASFATMYAWPRPVKTPPAPPGHGAATPQFRQAAAIIGGGATAVGTLWVLGYIAATNPAVLFGATRGEYWTSVASSGIPNLGAFMVAFGGILLAVATPSKWRTAGLGFLTVFGIWAISVGARSLIMYTALAAMIALARVRRMPRQRIALLLGTAGLVLVSAAGFFRSEGLLDADFTVDAFNPANGLVEMGGSIRPVMENLKYAHSYNEQPMHGATYIGFTWRAAESALGLPQEEGLQDLRLAGNELIQRIDVYQIGYSAVAESYRNWRTPGVVGVFMALGLTLGTLDRRRLGEPRAAAFTAITFYALLLHVRQPSIQLVPLLITGLILLAITTVTATAMRRTMTDRTDESRTLSPLPPCRLP